MSSSASTNDNRLHKKFAALALAASLTTFLTYASAALVTTLMQVYESHELTVAFGNFTQARTLSLVGCVGIAIATLRSAVVAQKKNKPFDPTVTSAMILPAVVTSLVVAIAVMCGTYTAASDQNPWVHWVLWLSAMPALVLTPATAWMTALFQSQNLDRVLLRITAARLFVTTSLSVGVVLLPLPGVWTAGSVGFLSSCGTAWTLWSLWQRCPQELPPGYNVVFGRIAPRGQRRAAWKSFAASLVAISDVLPVIVLLTLLGFVASLGDVREAATVHVVMSLVRLTVVPLKQTGSIAGRMALQQGGESGFVWGLFWLPGAMGVVFVAAMGVAFMAGAGFAESRVLMLLVCGQVAVDAVTLFLTSAYKVLQGPGFARWVYLVVIVGGAMPTLVVFASLGWTSPEALWSVMFVSRVLLFLGVGLLVGRSARVSTVS